MRRVIVLLLSIVVFGTAYVQGQGKSQDISQRFFEQQDKCLNLLKSQNAKEAELVCKLAVDLADRLGSDRELEKMGAYQMMGYAMMNQKRHQDALTYYSRAAEVVRSRLKDTDAELGRLYGDIGIAHHSLRDLDKAREFYRKAERTYQFAYSSINPEEVTEEGLQMKQGYMRALKNLLQHHALAAEQVGATAEAEEVKKRLANLP